MKKYLILLLTTLLFGANAATANEIDVFCDDDIDDINKMVTEWTDGIIALAPCNKDLISPSKDWKAYSEYSDKKNKMWYPTSWHFLGKGQKATMYKLGYRNLLYKGKKHQAPMANVTMIEQSTGKQKIIKKSVWDFYQYVTDNIFTVKKIEVSNIQAYLSSTVCKGEINGTYIAYTYIRCDFSIKDGIYTLNNKTDYPMYVVHDWSWPNSQKRGYILGDISLTIYYE